MNWILIVEDEIAICDLLKIGLESQGYEYKCATDGEIAADWLEENMNC